MCQYNFLALHLILHTYQIYISKLNLFSYKKSTGILDFISCLNNAITKVPY